jgi:predicted nucleic acid-binding protein
VIFSAVLDANALDPFSLRDTLLRLAELELYAPLWSERILEEMRQNLVERQITEEQADRLTAAMRAAFEEAEVDAAEIERLEPAMTNDPKGRHVLAAAVAAGSELIVTFNLDDFPAEACEPLGVEALHPPTSSCSTSMTSTPSPSAPPLSSRPPTSTRPGRSTGSSKRLPLQGSLGSSRPSARGRNLYG